MTRRLHAYAVQLDWTGPGETTSYTGYGRSHTLTAPGLPPILGSSDPAFRGDVSRWSPELLFLASISACHQLWYLHLCADAGLLVTGYTDAAEGLMQEHGDGSGEFTTITLHPIVTLRRGNQDTAQALHHQAHERCFLARSICCPVRIVGTVRQVAGP